MSVSKGPTYRVAMFNLIKSVMPGAPNGVLVQYGSVSDSDVDDIVLVQTVSAPSSGFADALGAGRMFEVLDLDITISCARGGNASQQIASERAWSLLALIETAVRVDITLGGLFIKCVRTKAIEAETQPDDEMAGRYGDLHVIFSAETRI
jgi:hypothetical protein